MIKRNLFFLFGILIIFHFCFVQAAVASQTVEVTYSFSENVSKTFINDPIKFSDVKLRIKTLEEATCRYSTSANVDYDDMTGFLSLETVHEKVFTGLSDGLYHYYVKCVDSESNWNETELKLTMRVNALVTGAIQLKDSDGDVISSNEPLSEGIFEVVLITSKEVPQAPSLKYSFDGGLVDSPLPLVGSGTSWKGYLLVDGDLEAAVVSFEFSASDLEGRTGTLLTSGNVFEIDTEKPSIIYDLDIVGYSDEIELDWHFSGNYKEFNIYRSLSPKVDRTDFYKSVDDSDFTDTWVEDGETYYYRVSVVDDAGNEGDLSKEVYATALLDDRSYSSGLAANLRGRVDNLLVEIDSASSDVSSIKSTISTKSDTEKDLFSRLGLGSELDKAATEISSLRKTVENYKLQDLTESELEDKISTSQIRLNVIQKKIPEDIIILDEETQKESLNEDLIEELIFEADSIISESDAQKSLKESMKIIDEAGLGITSNIYSIEIVYSDATRTKKVVVEREISAELENRENTYFIEVIPSDVLQGATNFAIKNSNYDRIKDNYVLSFPSDVKNIFYSFDKDIDLDSLGELKIGLVYLYEEDVSPDSITGYSFLNLDSSPYGKISLGIIGLILIAGIVWFFYRRRNNLSNTYLKILEKIKSANGFLQEGNSSAAKEIYRDIKEKYKALSNSEKKSIYSQIEVLASKISVSDLEEGLEKLRVKKDAGLFSQLEKIYDSLSEKYKKKLSKEFEELRIDMNISQLNKNKEVKK